MLGRHGCLRALGGGGAPRPLAYRVELHRLSRSAAAAHLCHSFPIFPPDRNYGKERARPNDRPTVRYGLEDGDTVGLPPLELS